MSERRFKVLYQGRSGCRAFGPKDVPWSLLAPHEAQAFRNHSQTLEELDARGGLSPQEMMCIIEDRKWHPVIETEDAATKRLVALLAKL